MGGCLGKDAEEASLSQHYQKSAEGYEQAWFYRNDSPYQDFLLNEHISFLKLEPRDTQIVDLGAGSCNFSAKLAKASDLPVACVEPSASLLQPDVPKDGCVKVLASCEDYFKERPKGVTKAILKETIHHLSFDDKGDTAGVFIDMVATLRQNGGGKLVVMTRPHDCSHFPFGSHVAAEWKKGQPEHSLYVNALRAAGFDTVDTQFSDFEISMPLQDWCAMVRSRFWSCYRNVSDAELEEDLAKLTQEREGAQNIDMVDKLLFITGTVLSSEGKPP